MISYLLNFTLCSAVLLGGYYLLLKSEAMFGFNRAYLLSALILSLIIPLILISQQTFPGTAVEFTIPLQQQIAGNLQTIAAKPVQIKPAAAHKSALHINLYILAYGAITTVLLFRFVKNLLQLRKLIRNNEQVTYQDARLILIDQQLTPHTFMRYIFLNKADYHQRRIEPEILNHELAHARQYHSLDLVLIELLRVFCWFNPLLLLYRRAMQLNHEFLADAAVLNKQVDISYYQQLLLNLASQPKSLTITSQLNYAITKNRLIMMYKNTSAAAAWFRRLALIPVLAIALTLFCHKSGAALIDGQSDSSNVDFMLSNRFLRSYPSTPDGISDEGLAQYNGIVAKYRKKVKGQTVIDKNITPADRTQLETLYKQMSRAQQRVQKFFCYFMIETYPKNKPTQQQLNLWKDSLNYKVYINEKKVPNSELRKYSPDAFVSVWAYSKTEQVSAGYGNRGSVNLLTKDGYEEIANRYDHSLLVTYVAD